MKLPESLPKIERTQYPSKDPLWGDMISRIKIVRYLKEIPLNYKTEKDHQILEEFILRAQRHFAELDPDFESQNE